MKRFIIGLSVSLLPCIALADSTSASELVVMSENDASSEMIRSRANALLSALRKDWAGTDSKPTRNIEIKASISEDKARGASTYFPVADGPLCDVKVEVMGNINGVIEDALPRQLSHIVLAEQIGAPPRWAEMGIGLLSESRKSQTSRWRTFREFRDTGELLPISELLAYMQYPRELEKTKVMYVQSMALSQFIIETAGRNKLIEFAADTIASGTRSAVRNHLGFDSVGDFDLAFRTWAAEQ